MPGGFPISPRWANPVQIGANTAASTGTTVTASASASTYGSWVAVSTSSPVDSNWALVTLSNPSTQTVQLAVDIGLGASGSEVAIVTALMLTGPAGSAVGAGATNYMIPLAIPAGQRISARAQCSSSGSVTCCVSIQLLGGGFTELTAQGPLDTIGFSSGTTLGTLIDPGASVNTKGAFTQITASSAVDYHGFFLAFDRQLGTSSGTLFLLDFALGASGSEVSIIANLAMNNLEGSIAVQVTPIFWLPIPAGQRISARAQASSAVIGSRKFGLTMYGIR